MGDISFAIDHLGKQERLTYLAYYDALTGLANTRYVVGFGNIDVPVKQRR